MLLRKKQIWKINIFACLLLDAHVDVIWKEASERRRKFDCVVLLKYSSNIQMIFKSWYTMRCWECLGQPNSEWGLFYGLIERVPRMILHAHCYCLCYTLAACGRIKLNVNFSKNRGKFIFDACVEGKQYGQKIYRRVCK